MRRGRLGAEDVRVLYRRTDREMPAFAFEYEHAKKEGAGFHWLVKPVRISGAQGHVAAVECVRVTPDLEKVPGSDFTIFCDMVILAIGQSRSLEMLSGVEGIETHRGLIAIDRQSGRTGNPKFYAGGDIVNGGREVVDAAADGKRAALGILSDLRAAHSQLRGSDA